MVHKHIFVLDRLGFGAGARWMYGCEGCAARAEVVPLLRRLSATETQVTASVRVRADGFGGFSVEELSTLGRLWLQIFNSFVASSAGRSSPVRRRRALDRAA